jgi:hypothetical protein
VFEPNPHLRVSPGGNLTPPEVIGRDILIAEVWAALTRQSVLLTSERRTGKTSVMQKMLAEPPIGFCPIKRSLQGITSPEEFARTLVADVESAAPGVLKKSIGERLQAAGVKKIATKPIAVEFAPVSAESWKEITDEVLGALDREVDETVIFLWDELPHMVADIAAERGPRSAREMLDVLRAVRERYPSVRMVLSGSLGIHHVVAQLLTEGIGMWVPTHDMLTIDVPPLSSDHAIYLAAELLKNEQIECEGLDQVAVTIAAEVDDLPYYVHHTIHQLQSRQRTNGVQVDAPLAEQVVAEAVRSPLDPWQLKHYLDRVPVYYGERADLANRVLDTIAVATEPPNFAEIQNGLAVWGVPPEPQQVDDMLTSLCRDYYIDSGPRFRFRRELVRRAWRARRPNL